MKKFSLILILFFHSLNCFAQDTISKDEFVIKIQNHRFEPEIVSVPANTKFKIIIENLDNTIEEFESDDLKKDSGKQLNDASRFTFEKKSNFSKEGTKKDNGKNDDQVDRYKLLTSNV